jgi:hypothetical protein
VVLMEYLSDDFWSGHSKSNKISTPSSASVNFDLAYFFVSAKGGLLEHSNLDMLPRLDIFP